MGQRSPVQRKRWSLPTCHWSCHTIPVCFKLTVQDSIGRQALCVSPHEGWTCEDAVDRLWDNSSLTACRCVEGCDNGAVCKFCHLCEPGEKKRRQKALAHFEVVKRYCSQMVHLHRRNCSRHTVSHSAVHRSVIRLDCRGYSRV